MARLAGPNILFYYSHSRANSNAAANQQTSKPGKLANQQQIIPSIVLYLLPIMLINIPGAEDNTTVLFLLDVVLLPHFGVLRATITLYVNNRNKPLPT